jgi:CBS domain-containing protein
MPPESSQTEIERIERFVAAYNAIDDVLQREMPAPGTFRAAVDSFARDNPWWRDAENLRVFAALRNFLVHEKTRPFDYPCVPGEAAVREIEAIRERFTNPKRIGEVFGREVLVLTPAQPIGRALELIDERKISRFPIVDSGRFVGLLTESMIAQHLARIVASGRRFEPHTAIRDVLPRAGKRRTHRFADGSTSVSQAAGWFHEDIYLEAILICDGGREGESLRGIVTRGDVVGWNK